MMEQTTTRLVFLIAFLAYDTFSLFSDRFSFHGGSFQGWEVPQLHNESEFCNQGYGISIGIKNRYLNILSVTCKVIFTEYTSSVIPVLQLQNGFCDVKLEKI